MFAATAPSNQTQIYNINTVRQLQTLPSVHCHSTRHSAASTSHNPLGHTSALLVVVLLALESILDIVNQLLEGVTVTVGGRVLQAGGQDTHIQ